MFSGRQQLFIRIVMSARLARPDPASVTTVALRHDGAFSLRNVMAKRHKSVNHVTKIWRFWGQNAVVAIY